MPNRAAIVTGASRGIGLAIAEALAEEGYDLTVTARKPEGIERSADALREKGNGNVEVVAGNLAHEDAVKEVVQKHRDRYGRLDVLVNNAGMGVGAQAGEHQTKFIDMQFDLNLRAIILFYRESLDMLRAAAQEHGQAWVVNLASYAGKKGQPWLSVYSTTKAGVISYTEAMNTELAGDGIRSVAFCPGFVDTDMADFIKEQLGPDTLIRPSDIAEGIRFILRLSRTCVVPEIVFQRLGETIGV